MTGVASGPEGAGGSAGGSSDRAPGSRGDPGGGSPALVDDACDRCLRRTELVAALAGALDVEWRRRDRAPARVLALPDEALLTLDRSGRVAAEYARWDAGDARERCRAAGLHRLCRCSAAYPDRLRDLPDPPAVLHVSGSLAALAARPATAVVGARLASSYGLEVARGLGRDLAAAGVPVVSGMALGVDAAVHVGALSAAGPATAAPVAVLAGGADVAYPAAHRRLHAQLAGRGCVVSELPPGFAARRWCFVARNRIIAALSEVTVLVEAATRSGSLTTAGFAEEMGRTVAAVPGQITSQLSSGTNGLLAAGAAFVQEPRDVLDLLFGVGHGLEPAQDGQPLPAEPRLAALLRAVEDGRGSLGLLAQSPEEAADVLHGLSELEVRGFVRRGFGGHYVRVA